MAKVTILVKKITGTTETLGREEGLNVWEVINYELSRGNEVELDFIGIDIETHVIIGSFFNPIVSKLIKNYGEDIASQLFVNIQNLSEIDIQLLNRTIERVKKGSPEFKKFFDEAVDND